MAKCSCGARPKKGAPPISTLRLQDLSDPNYFFKGAFIASPPPPSIFSVVYGEDTATLCNRDPDLLQFEFAPYSTSASTAALKKLWRNNCECKPEKGIWTHTYKYKRFYTDSSFPNGRDLSYETGGNSEGAFVGMRQQIIVTPTSKIITWFGYTASDNYKVEKQLNSGGLQGVSNPAVSSTFSQVQLTSGCYAPGDLEPEQPEGVSSPWIPTTPIIDPPPVAYIPENPPKRPVVFPPDPKECCDCC